MPNIKADTDSSPACSQLTDTICGASELGASPAIKKYAQLLGLLILVALIVAAYSPVLFNFFAGDDFVHLTWLYQAINSPELIWRNFHSSWLDGTTTRFYRPLISIFMVNDYVLWGLNGLGFRATNLLFHLVNSVLIFLAISKIESSFAGSKNSAKFGIWSPWAYLCALLFALYPLHPEAVSWITGRVDTIVTTFILASFWCFTVWQEQKKAAFFAMSILAMILALLSKEMSITLPALLVIYQLLSKPWDKSLKASSLFKQLYQRLLPTAAFWFTLAGYFALRRYALGTFVGGYDDSLFFIADWKLFLGNWLHALRMFVIPINKELLGAHSALTKSWELTIIATVAAFAWRLAYKKQGRLAAFLLFWLVLSLIPVYKLFSIGDDLQASRLAYLATGPLCALLTFPLSGFALSDIKAKGLKLSLLLACCLVVLSGILLWTNNQAWAKAGRESNAIRSNLQNLYNHISGDPQVMLIGLPDQINGAYVCRNALWGMIHKPQLSRDINNCIMLNAFEPIMPFGFLKESIFTNQQNIKIYHWSNSHFQQVSLPPDSVAKYNSWSINNAIISLPNADAWNIDFIGVQLSVPSSKSTNNHQLGADLLYSNDAQPNFQLGSRAHCSFSSSQQYPYLIFALRNLPEWSLGGKSHNLKLLLPKGLQAVITQVEIIPAQQIMPKLNFANSGYLGTKGFLHLSEQCPKASLMVDATQIKNACGTIMEISRPNLFFENQNTAQTSQITMRFTKPSTTHGSIDIFRNTFPATGLYELRIWAINKKGERIGVAGDHIVVAVDS